MNRRHFLRSAALLAGSLPWVRPTFGADPLYNDLRDRIHGMLVGSMIGDALGSPLAGVESESVASLDSGIQFWTADAVLNAQSREALLSRMQLHSYATFHPGPESVGAWVPNAEPGTITEFSRHKLVLLQALHYAARQDNWPVTAEVLARAYLDWSDSAAIQDNRAYQTLSSEWLKEWEPAARWVLGNRDPEIAIPPERLGGGLPTCAGQKVLLPLAALSPGEPGAAYRSAYMLGFFDNGIAKDVNAALVAGLSVALKVPTEIIPDPGAWGTITDAMLMTDPFGYGNVRGVDRSVNHWFEVAKDAARGADGHPARLFATLDRLFANSHEEEAIVPFVAVLACLELCGYHPLVALQLSVDWGRARGACGQLAGALIGALHGALIFPERLRVPVQNRLAADYKFTLADEVEFLLGLNSRTDIRGLLQTQ